MSATILGLTRARVAELDDPRELLEEHRMEELESSLRAAVIGCLLDVLGSKDCCEGDCADLGLYRWELSLLRREERRVQRLNGTQLVLDCPTFDLEAGDELVDVSESDLDRLAYHGISVPGTCIWHGEVSSDPLSVWD